MKTIKEIITLLFLFVSFSMMAQSTITVTGRVTEGADKLGVIGANVIVKGTSIGTITDLDGNFSLAGVPSGATLVVSSIGFQSVEVKASSTPLLIQMSEDNKQLDEVVVIGYGTARKRDLTGSIVSISGDDIKNAPENNAVQALQGKVPGLTVTSSGSAGGSPTIRLRGVATVNASTNPLYVVDGMFTDNIDFVNPNEIAQIEVLKDPSSLAIFGVQGANGVIIITTNRANKGSINISYDGYAGVQYLENRDRVGLTNASEFTMLYNEQLKNADPTAADWEGNLLGKGTDWQSYIFRPAVITNHGVTVTSSSDKANTLFSLAYFLQDGIVKYNSYQRFNGRWSGDYNVSKFLKIGGNVNLSRWDTDPASASVQDATRAIPTYQPYAPVEDQNPNNLGSYYTPSPSIQKDVPNPVAYMELNKGNSDSYGYRGVGNIYAEFIFLKDFSLKFTGYGDLGNSYGSTYVPHYDVNNSTSSSSHKTNTTSFSRTTSEYVKLQGDIILNYNKTFGKNRINAMVGYTARVSESQGFSAGADSLLNGDLWNIPEDFWMLNSGSANSKTNSDWYEAEAFMSYMARVSYSYADKYLVSATFRADGSSKFSPTNRWGYFPSIGLGWVMTEEQFMEPALDYCNYLKIKASWGKLGNDKIGNYLYFPVINPMGQQITVDGVTYYIPTVNNLVDENIHWEVVTGFDIGFDSRLFNNRLALDLGYFTKTTSDLLAYVEPPVSVGAGYAITNAGSVRNSGFEFLVSWNDKIGDFTYGIGANGGTLKNTVLSLGNDDSDIVSGTYHRTSVGHSVGALYGYVQDGIFQTQEEIDAYYPATWTSKPGDIRYKDLNGDEKIDDKDRTFIGQTIPKFTYGINLNFGYKGFDVMLDFNGVYGNSLVNTKKLPGFAQFNYYDVILDRWHGEGTSNTEPILDPTRGHNYLPSTNLLESGSYFRLRSVQLGYTLQPKALKKMHCQKMRVFLAAQNALTFKYSTGYTPEIAGGILDGGVDNGSTYPIPAVFTGGLSFTF